VKLKIVIH